jgi:hypothetical protein
VDQLLQLAGRAGGQALRSVEVATLTLGISALAVAASSVEPAVPSPARVSERDRLLDTAVRLYAGVYGLTVAQAEAEVRAEAGL